MNQAERALTRLVDRMSFDDPSQPTELALQVCGAKVDDPAFPGYVQTMGDSRDWVCGATAKAAAFDFDEPE